MVPRGTSGRRVNRSIQNGAGGDRDDKEAEPGTLHVEEPLTSPATSDEATATPNIIRRLYDWVLGWADSRYGVLALAILAFAESSFFPIPPDVLLIGLAVGAPKRSMKFAAVCSAASVVGGVLGYGIGHFVWQQTQHFFFSTVPGFTPEVFARVQGLFSEYDFWIVFAAGFTPIPYKVFTISAGVFDIAFPMFLLASLVGRSARFFLVAGLIFVFGPTIRRFIDRYFNLLAIAFFVLLLAGFGVIKMCSG